MILKKDKKKLFKISLATILVATILFCLLLMLKSQNFFNDPGFLWHLRDGEDIVKTFSIPYVDDYLSIKRAWISDQWLSDSFLYIIYMVGNAHEVENFNLIYYVLTFLYIFFIFVFYKEKVLAKYSNSFISVITSFIVMSLCSIHYIARPVIFSFFLMIYFLYLLEVFKDKLKLTLKDSIENNKNIKKINLQFFILFFLWANIHPSFIMAFLIWGFFLIESFIKERKNFNYKIYLKTSSIIVLATLINPYFLSLHKSILFLGSSKYFMSLNSEWKAVELFSFHWWFITIPTMLIVLFFILNKDYRKKVGFTYFCSLLVFYIYAINHVRGTTYFGIILAVPLSVLLYSLKFPKTLKDSYMARLLKGCNKILILYFNNNKYCYAAILLFFLTIFFKNQIYNISLMPSKDKFPYGVVNYIKEHSLRGNITASPNYGGFLIWHLRDGVKPIIDDRNTLLGEESYKNYFLSLKSSDNMKQYNIKEKAKYTLVDGKSSIDKKLFKSNDFLLLFRDNKHALYEMKN